MKIKDITVCARLAEELMRSNLSQNKVTAYYEITIKTVCRWEKNSPIPADKLALLTLLG